MVRFFRETGAKNNHSQIKMDFGKSLSDLNWLLLVPCEDDGIKPEHDVMDDKNTATNTN